jgi:GntR family transcriptional repressor for pyruvate dehydrogenase complex
MPQMLADDIRRRLVAGELLPGQPLPPERELLETYGVARSTLREAVRILEAESLVQTIRGVNGGVVVQAPDPQVVIRQVGVLLQLSGATLGDVYVARTAMEVAAVRALTLHPDPTAVDGLQQHIADGRRSLEGSLEEFGPIAGAFHRALVHHAANVTMSFVVDLLGSLTDATYTGQVLGLAPAARDGQVKTALRSWSKLVRLIEAGDPDAAETHWTQHLRTVGAGLVQDGAPLAAVVLPDAG